MNRQTIELKSTQDSPLMVIPAHPTKRQMEKVNAIQSAINAIVGAVLEHLGEPTELNRLYAEALKDFCCNHDFEDNKYLFETAWICFEWIQSEAINQDTFKLYQRMEERQRVRERKRLERCRARANCQASTSQGSLSDDGAVRAHDD